MILLPVPYDQAQSLKDMLDRVIPLNAQEAEIRFETLVLIEIYIERQKRQERAITEPNKTK